jgi:hypothetical protein
VPESRPPRSIIISKIQPFKTAARKIKGREKIGLTVYFDLPGDEAAVASLGCFLFPFAPRFVADEPVDE